MARTAAYLARAREALDKGDVDEAKGFERVALAEADRAGRTPTLDHSEVHAQIAERHLVQRNYAAAAEELRAAIAVRKELGVEDRRAYDFTHRLGMTLREQGDAVGAVRCFADALDMSKRLFGENFGPAVPTRIGMAYTLIRLGRPHEAEQALLAARAVCENLGPANCGRGLAMVNEALAALHRHGHRASEADADAGRARDALRAPEERRAREETSEEAARLAEELEIIEGPAEPEQIDAILQEMDDKLVGLDEIKRQVRKKADFLRVQAKRKEEGLKSGRRAFHLLLLGPSGTGKTTVAAYLGRICFALGLLETGDVVVVTRGKLVRGHVGQTAIRTNEVIDFALGKVLFIDEAYTLAKKDAGSDFGPEAVAELMVRMVSDSERLVVAAAGYTREMTEFLESNTGFQSRFTDEFTFDHYDPGELHEIFVGIAKANDYRLTPDADRRVLEACEQLHAERTEFFGNGRTMNNLFSDAIEEQASRLVEQGRVDDREALVTLEADDVVVRDSAVAPKPVDVEGPAPTR
jgi:SpoVK/Ycf46/Vps4 family AAA+-type ATPase